MRRERHYWALGANPKLFQVDKAIQDNKIHTWLSKGSDVRQGDRAVIWKFKGNGRDRGVIAFAEVLTDPEVGLEPSAYWKTSNIPDRSVSRIHVRFVSTPTLPLWIGGPAHEILTSLTVSRATGGTVFKIRPDPWDSLMEYIGGWPVARSS